MAQCANCNATILFGGHTAGDLRFGGPACLMKARPFLRADEFARDVTDDVTQLHEYLVALAVELQQLRAAQNEVYERVDFLERAVGQLRAEAEDRERPN